MYPLLTLSLISFPELVDIVEVLTETNTEAKRP
jgi:hypothetical protein